MALSVPAPDVQASSTGRAVLVAAALCLPAFMVSLDDLVVTTALPAIRTALHASISDLQWIVDAYLLPFAALLLAAVPIGDRFGRRATFLTGIAVFTAASAVCALATTTGVLVAARVVQGAAGALVWTLSLALLVARTPARRRPMAVGIWSGFTGLGIALGPVVGGALVEEFRWTWIFWLNVPVGLVALALAGTLPRESPGLPRRFSPGSVVLFAVAVAVGVWGVVEAPVHGWASPRTLGALAGAAVLLGTFLRWDGRVAHPMLPRRLFGSPEFALINALSLVLNVGVFGSIFLLAQFFQVVNGLDPLQAGLRTLPCSLAPVLVAPLFDRLVARWGVPRLILVGLTLVTVSLCWLAATFSAGIAYTSIVTPFVLAGVGLGLSYPLISTGAVEAVPEDDRGIAVGVNNTVRVLGIAVGVALVVSVFATSGGYTPDSFVDGLIPALATATASVAIGLGLAVLLFKRSVSTR